MKNDDRLSDTPTDVRMLCLSEPAGGDGEESRRLKQLTAGVPDRVIPSTGWAARFRRFRQRLQLRIAGLLYRLARWVDPQSRAGRRGAGVLTLAGGGSAAPSPRLSELPPSVTLLIWGSGRSASQDPGDAA